MFSDESHFTEAGHRRAAALLLEVIQKHWPALAHP
jgi:lysophospholipase L1-like esterase